MGLFWLDVVKDRAVTVVVMVNGNRFPSPQSRITTSSFPPGSNNDNHSPITAPHPLKCCVCGVGKVPHLSRSVGLHRQIVYTHHPFITPITITTTK